MEVRGTTCALLLCAFTSCKLKRSQDDVNMLDPNFLPPMGNILRLRDTVECK